MNPDADVLSLGLSIQLAIEELNAVVIVTLLLLFVALIEKLRSLMIRVTGKLTKNLSHANQHYKNHWHNY